MQLVSYVVFFSSALIFYLLQLNTYPHGLRIAALVVYTILALLSALLAFLATFTNPTDPELLRERNAF